MTGSSEKPSPGTPPAETDNRRVVPAEMLRRKTPPSGSAATRLDAPEEKATRFPSAEIDGSMLLAFPCTPLVETLTRLVTPVSRSRQNTSRLLLVSPATRFD